MPQEIQYQAVENFHGRLQLHAAGPLGRASSFCTNNQKMYASFYHGGATLNPSSPRHTKFNLESPSADYIAATALLCTAVLDPNLFVLIANQRPADSTSNKGSNSDDSNSNNSNNYLRNRKLTP